MLIKNKITIVGLGYVGLPLAKLLKRKKFIVEGITKSGKKKSSIVVSSDFKSISNSSYIFICVPTPIDKFYNPDHTILNEVIENIGKNLKKNQTVILESTVDPGVCDEIIIPKLEHISMLREGKDFYFGHCPERINPGDKHWTVENIPRVVGANSSKSLKKVKWVYSKILKGSIYSTKDIKEAESVKIVENAFRDINIAFVNELAMSFSKLDIDITRVIKAASTKPFSFLPHYPGIGVGGHCIPVDPYYLIKSQKNRGFNHEFLILARKINNFMPVYTSKILINELDKLGISLTKAKVAVLGLAYKANIADIRESPSLKLIEILKKKKISLSIFDPYETALSTEKNIEMAVKSSDAIIIATDHSEFIRKPVSFWAKNTKVIIDGRNCLNKENIIKSGIVYKGIGR